MRFCVYCGKQFAVTDRFCPFCGQHAAASPAAPKVAEKAVQTQDQPSQPNQSAIFTPGIAPQSEKPKAKSSKLTTRGVLIGLGAFLGLGALILGIVFLPAALSSKPKELAAFEVGIAANCDRLGSEFDAAFSAETDELGNPLIVLSVGLDEVLWSYELVAGNVYLFEIDSIYSPSAVRAEKLGCSLRFQAQP